VTTGTVTALAGIGDDSRFLTTNAWPELNNGPSAYCHNVNSKGERIYHTPHQNAYTKIKMDKGGGRRWFCTPEEAESRRMAQSS
jgi:hypothetical protein